jgi:folate-binding Fe-S cluster repair protein YgfZ
VIGETLSHERIFTGRARRAAWIVAATTGAPAHTTSVSAPARRACNTGVLTSETPLGTVVCETIGALSRAKAARSAVSPSTPKPVSSLITATCG